MTSEQFAIQIGLMAIVGIGLLLMGWLSQRAYLRSMDDYNKSAAALAKATRELESVTRGIVEGDEEEFHIAVKETTNG